MPGQVKEHGGKRKRATADDVPNKQARQEPGLGDDPEAEILRLEKSIHESAKNYNNIRPLLAAAIRVDEDGDIAVVAGVALCRVFIRLLSTGVFSYQKALSDRHNVVVKWLNERFIDYRNVLYKLVARPWTSVAGVTLSMRILKAEAQYLVNKEPYNFPENFFTNVLNNLFHGGSEESRRVFREEYSDKYDDVRFYTLKITG